MKDGWMQQHHQSYIKYRHTDRQRDRKMKECMKDGWMQQNTKATLTTDTQINRQRDR